MRRIIILMSLLLLTINWVNAIGISNDINANTLNFGGVLFTVEDAMNGLSTSQMINDKVYIFVIKNYVNRKLTPTMYISVFHLNGTNIITQEVPLKSNDYVYSITSLVVNETIKLIMTTQSGVYIFDYDSNNYTFGDGIHIFFDKIPTISISGTEVYFQNGVSLNISDLSIKKLNSKNNNYIVKTDIGFILFNTSNDISFEDVFNRNELIIYNVTGNTLINERHIELNKNITFSVPDFRSIDSAYLTNPVINYYNHKSPTNTFVYPNKIFLTSYVKMGDYVYFIFFPSLKTSDYYDYTFDFYIMKINSKTNAIIWLKEYSFNQKFLNMDKEFISIKKFIANKKLNSVDLYFIVYGMHYRNPTSIRSKMLILRIDAMTGKILTGNKLNNTGAVLIYDYSDKYTLISDVNFNANYTIVSEFVKEVQVPHLYILDNDTYGRTTFNAYNTGFYRYGIFGHAYIYSNGGFTEVLLWDSTLYYRRYFMQVYGTTGRVTLKIFYTVRLYNSNTYLTQPNTQTILTIYNTLLPPTTYDYYYLRIIYAPTNNIEDYGIGYDILLNDNTFSISITNIPID